MLASHLGIITMIPIVLTVLHFVHRVPLGRIWSVSEGPRWRYLLACLLISVGVFAGYVGTLPLRGQPLHWQPQPGLLPFLLVILLLTPFQALAEEVLFRGYLLQGLGALFRSPWPAVLGSALLFALFHGAQNPQLFLSRLAFGLLAGWLVVRTGGLEAGIAAHVINNLFAFLLAGLTSTIAQVRQVTEVGWAQAFSDVITFAIVAVLTSVVAARMRVPDCVEEPS
ncbi:CPBP family intramembrane metalloprotease [Naumannella sp. ID2617S]|nr:CPBP family intramembrane metalloprotease [Naumannella sp. ID2617S]